MANDRFAALVHHQNVRHNAEDTWKLQSEIRMKAGEDWQVRTSFPCCWSGPITYLKRFPVSAEPRWLQRVLLLHNRIHCCTACVALSPSFKTSGIRCASPATAPLACNPPQHQGDQRQASQDAAEVTHCTDFETPSMQQWQPLHRSRLGWSPPTRCTFKNPELHAA